MLHQQLGAGASSAVRGESAPARAGRGYRHMGDTARMPLIRRSVRGKGPTESGFAFFENRIGRLLHRGVHVGHVASIIQWTGIIRLRPLPTFLITWLDGSREYIAEDPVPYAFTQEMQAGRVWWLVRQPHICAALCLTGDTETDFVIEWMNDDDSATMWPKVGFPANQPDLTQLGPDEDP